MKELIDETTWYNLVEAELENRGLIPDTDNDGWDFAYTNGMSPLVAIAFMDNN